MTPGPVLRTVHPMTTTLRIQSITLDSAIEGTPFETLPEAERRVLERQCDVVRVAPGTTIVPEGAHPSWFFCVLAGTVTVQRGTRPEVRGPGHCFPEALLRNNPCEAGPAVVAATEAVVLSMGVRQFRGALDELPAFSRTVLGPVVETVA